MRLSEEQKREHAHRIAAEVLNNLEYCQVYEDELLNEAEEDWGDIHSLITSKMSPMFNDELEEDRE